jgi:DNA-binding transcriptional ArsR family regulator
MTCLLSEAWEHYQYRMVAAANMVEVAALVGDTARATILSALMDGQALTGRELAFLARVSPSTASEHLAKLVEARLLTVVRRRRFNYYRIASPLVANMLESIKAVAAIEVPPRYQPRCERDAALRYARVCYDHIAGELGVAIADTLIANGSIILADDGGEVTEAGAEFLMRFGAYLQPKARNGRIYCRPCLDWSERRYHVAGHIGAEICRRCFELEWLKRQPDTRSLQITATGYRGFADLLGLHLPDVHHQPDGRASTRSRLRRRA